MIVTALVSSAAIAGPWTREGRVVSIQDGETFTLLDSDKAQVKIRFARADAPEKGQPHYRVSGGHLARLVSERTMRADCYKVDKYRRDVCRVYLDREDIGAARLEFGMAWWFGALRQPSSAGPRTTIAGSQP